MRVDVSTEIVIERSRAAVSEYSANPDNAPFWMDNVKTVTWQSEKPLQAGTLLAFETIFLGRRLVSTFEVVTFVPEERLVMQTKRPFPIETTYRWYSLSDGSTKMQMRSVGDLNGLWALLAPWAERQMSRNDKNDLAHLRTILENPQAAIGFT